jgi:hypothetical protein
MYALEPGETPTRTLNWNPLGFLSHIKRRTNDDRFPPSLWEFWFCFTLGVPFPTLIGPSQWCVCNAFHYDSCGDHLQTCRVKSVTSQAHDWVVYRLGDILGSVGHRVKIHKIKPVTGKERGDLEIQDYVVLQKPQEQADRLPPPRTLILDFTLTNTRYDSLGKRFYIIANCIFNRPDPIVFLPTVVDATGRLHDDFSQYSCTLTVKLRFWITKYRRNRINFASFVRPAILILRGQWGSFWRKLQP